MSKEKTTWMSMEPYGMDFSVEVSLAFFASLICMIGLQVDLGSGMLEDYREIVFTKTMDAKSLAELRPDLRADECFYQGYYMTHCMLLLAVDAYIEGAPVDFGQIVRDRMLEHPSVNSKDPNFKKFFH